MVGGGKVGVGLLIELGMGQGQVIGPHESISNIIVQAIVTLCATNAKKRLGQCTNSVQ